MKIFFGCLLVGLTALCDCAMADSWFPSLLPGPAISGPAGSTIGWGYSITNDSATQWLVLEGLTESPFEEVDALDPVFDFPILAPDATGTEDYVMGTSGLLGLTWSASAPLFYVNSGDFIFSADWYSGDPFGGGSDLGAAPQETVSYTAQVVAPESSAPEPATIDLCGCTLFMFGLLRFRERRKAA
jgi:hypothetical protein